MAVRVSSLVLLLIVFHLVAGFDGGEGGRKLRRRVIVAASREAVSKKCLDIGLTKKFSR